MLDGKYSITKAGEIILIPIDKPIKLRYYEEHFGLFNSLKEAEKEKKRRQLANRWLKDHGYGDSE